MGNIATIQDVKHQQTLNVWCLRVAYRHNNGLSVKEGCHNNNIPVVTTSSGNISAELALAIRGSLK